MHITGIISEYNPFHSGHAYHIAQCREHGATHIVCVMSGNFVQRGEAAVFDKWTRAKAAVLGGADLIIELPTRVSVSTAERFASGAVELLDRLSCISTLSFGSECGDIELLKTASESICSEKIKPVLERYLSSGTTFSKARSDAVCTVFGKETAEILKKPNNILATEYIKSLRSMSSSIKPHTVLRSGHAHDDTSQGNGFVSSSYLRTCEIDKYNQFMPIKCAEVFESAANNGLGPVQFKSAETAILSVLRQNSTSDFSRLPDVSEGLENRIAKAVVKARDIDELYGLIKSKRYSHSRIRRIILSAYLSLTEQEQIKPISYARVLAANSRGLEVMKVIKNSSDIPIDFSLSSLSKTSLQAEKDANTESRITDLYALLMPQIQPCGLEFTTKAQIIGDKI